MSLEIKRDDRFQRREWRAERIGWVLVTALVMAGLFGLLGRGPLSSSTARSPGELVTVSYSRVSHYEADESITFSFGAGAVEDGTVTVGIRGSWPAGVDLQSITPEPSEQSAVPGGVILEFAVEEVGDLAATVSYRAQDLGKLDAEVSVGEDSATLTQLVLP